MRTHFAGDIGQVRALMRMRMFGGGLVAMLLLFADLEIPHESCDAEYNNT